MTRAMNAALTTKQSAAAGKQAPEALHVSKPTIGVKRAAPAAAAVDGASSSDEDSSDEAYAARHAPWELEERTRFMTYQTGALVLTDSQHFARARRSGWMENDALTCVGAAGQYFTCAVGEWQTANAC